MTTATVESDPLPRPPGVLVPALFYLVAGPALTVLAIIGLIFALLHLNNRRRPDQVGLPGALRRDPPACPATPAMRGTP